MIDFKTWREYQTAPTTPATGSDIPTADDYNFYQTKLSGNVKRYLQWLVQELERTSGRMNLVRKGFIIQEVMDALGLNAAQVTRLSNNIKKGFQAWQAAQGRNPTVPPAPIR